MLKHQFGMMMADPEPGQIFEEYEPEKYDCIAVDEECIQVVIERLKGINIYDEDKNKGRTDLASAPFVCAT